MIEKSNISDDNEATIVNPVDSKNALALKAESPATSSQMGSIYGNTTHITSSAPDAGSSAYIQLKLGSVIKDTFELVVLLGSGGMGTVYKALNKVWAEVEARDPYVAIKILKPELSADKQLVRSLYSDFDRTKMLAECPNIIKVHGFDRDGPLVYMTMEYLSGQTLGDYLKHVPMKLAQAWFIIEGIGNAIAYAHEHNIVHRDIKPGNIFITDDGIVKVLDFGIASKINEHKGDETKFSGQELGALTVAYASPEMQRDYPPDPRDDIYAFACVIYEVLTGKQFYKQKTHKAAPIKGLNSRQMEALNKALAFERDQRIASVHELLEKLQPVKIAWVKYLGIGVGVIIVIGLALWKLPLDVKQLSGSHPAQSSVITKPQSQTSTPAPISEPTQVLVPAPITNQKPIPIVAPVLPPQETAQISSELGNSSTSSDGVVHLQTSKPEYKNGEPFHLSFTLAQSRYVKIIDRDAKGVVTILRPNRLQPDKLLPANKKHLFPPKGINAPVEGPSGNCTVTIVASTRPFSKAAKLLNADGSVSEQVQQRDSYSWTQVRYQLQ